MSMSEFTKEEMKWGTILKITMCFTFAFPGAWFSKSICRGEKLGMLQLECKEKTH